MTREELAARFTKAADEVMAIEEELNEIDARFGDADHGLTMAKIAKTIRVVAGDSTSSVNALVAELAEAVGSLGGGAAIPLWSSWLEGLAETAPDKEDVGMEEIKAMFASAFEMLDFMSGAQKGDKTLMDAFIPAEEAIEAYAGDDMKGLFAAAAAAAAGGAESTKDFPAKYGRAKYYGEKTIGTCDAGALSAAAFFRGLARE